MNPHTDAWGIDHAYIDAAGEEHTVAPETVRALREVIGDPAAGGSSGPLVTRRGARLPGRGGQIELEDGTLLPAGPTVPDDLPFGYHRLHDATGQSRRLIVGPGRCHLPDRRGWGWNVQLYATRSADSWGIGDLADLRELGNWSAGQGARFMLVNPLHAVAPTTPQQPSPYFPTSRRFLNPLYLRVEEVPGAERAVAEVERAARAGRALNSHREIDRDEVWRLKLAALEAIRAAHEPTGGGLPGESDFAQWQAEQGQALTQFATFCVLAEQHGTGWRGWPEDLHDPRGAAVAKYAVAHAERVRFFAWLQWLTSRQLAGAGGAVGLFQDLPIGVDPDGADAWVWQDQLAAGITVGSPPDEFNTRGQDWGLPPFDPHRLVGADYRPFVDTVRAAMPAGGGLRVDHVMGLFRLWWIPEGADPAQGAYVRYPAEDLLEIVALESMRAQAVVVGEDLGTVEPGVREAMTAHAMLSYRLLWFETDDPADWPELAMAAVTTHDLPTVAGLWDGSDLASQQRLGLAPNVEATNAIRKRLAADGQLGADADSADAVIAAYELLARAPSLLLTATLDDAAGEPERPNIPGADGARPNWSLAQTVTLAELQKSPLALRIADRLRDATTHSEESP